MKLRFIQLDVFTDTPLAGNPLAVFPEAAGLSTSLMQQIAREMNLSETTFVTSRGDSGNVFDVRIFTPLKEMAFAGHPTIGTAFHLFSSLPGCSQITLKLQAGAVDVWSDTKETGFVYFKPPPAALGTVIEGMDFISELTGLRAADLLDNLPIQTAGTGTNYLLTPVVSIEALERATCNESLLATCEAKYGFDKLTIFTPHGYRQGSTFATRMFAPLHGVPEDPATGSSASALTFYLRKHNAIADTGNDWFAIDQGYSIDRESTIFARANIVDGQVDVRIGGSTVIVATGILEI